MTATDYIPLDTTLRGRPRLEPRSRNGLVLDRKARRELLDRRGGQGDEGRFLREAAATALGNAALGVAAGAAAPLFRDAARTAVNLSGAGPRVVLPVGPNGMRGIRRAGLSTPELEATRARLPGETADMWFANPRLSAAGRAATRTNDSAVDRLAARFAERRDGALSARGMLAEPEAMSAAYPRGMAETTVRTRPAAGRRYGHSRVPATAESGAEITLYDVPGRAGYGRGDFAHEFLHTLSRREPFAVSRGYEFDPAVVSKARAAGSLDPETLGRFAYSTRVDENSARLLEAMNEAETTTMRGLDASGRIRVGWEPGGVPAARSAGRPNDYPVYMRAEDLQPATASAPVPEYQWDSKGGDINDGRHGNFRNFLATDEVPETIFGIPVVQDESGYTEKDVEFFKENPKAAGFYEMGDEGDAGAQEDWGGANTVERVSAPYSGPETEEEREARLLEEYRARTPVMRAAPARPDAVVQAAPSLRERILGMPEERFWGRMWKNVPGASSVVPEVRESVRANVRAGLLPEEEAELGMIRQGQKAMESAMAVAAGVPAASGRLPAVQSVLRQGYGNIGMHHVVRGLKVSEADLAAAARHFYKSPHRIEPSDYAAWLNYQLSGGGATGKYATRVLGEEAYIPVEGDPALVAARLGRAEGSASPDALRHAGFKQVSSLPLDRLDRASRQAWVQLKMFPPESLYGTVGKTGGGTVPIRISDHWDRITPVDRFISESGASYLLPRPDAALTPELKTALRLGSEHPNVSVRDLFAGTGADSYSVRFDWQDVLRSDRSFFGGKKMAGESVPWIGQGGKLAHEDSKGGNTRAAEGAEGTERGLPAKETPRYYKVQPGDTLSKISKATKVSMADIARYSKLADADRLKAGQTLMLVEPYSGSWNNPGNIKKGKAEYEGETGAVESKTTPGTWFLTFGTAEAGLNAQGQVIGQMVREKIPQYHSEGKIPSADFTVHNLINVYAPPTDRNDTPGYVKFVSKRLGVDKDEVLDMADVEKMADLLEAIATRDSGPDKAKWFRRSDYVNAAKMMPIPAKTRKGWKEKADAPAKKPEAAPKPRKKKETN